MPSFFTGRLRAASPPSPSVPAGGACCGGAGGGLGSSCWGRIGRRVPRIGRENSLTGVLNLPVFGKEVDGSRSESFGRPRVRGRVKRVRNLLGWGPVGTSTYWDCKQYRQEEKENFHFAACGAQGCDRAPSSGPVTAFVSREWRMLSRGYLRDRAPQPSAQRYNHYS